MKIINEDKADKLRELLRDAQELADSNTINYFTLHGKDDIFNAIEDLIEVIEDELTEMHRIVISDDFQDNPLIYTGK